MAIEYVEQREGNFYIAGTRVSLDSVVISFRRGDSPETICQSFEGMRLEEVYGAITYYLANQEAVDAYLTRKDAMWVEGKNTAAPLPDRLRERLMMSRGELRSARRP